ncbi:MAG: hypothetical protein GY941_20125 [Planctomycetes bacterium]|nr:hypothetical protein [Planctomycetota bacterium]
MKTYPKIWALGGSNIRDILEGEVEITEKLDGSQIGFGKDIEGNLVIRSKGAVIDQDDPQKLFAPAVKHILSVQHLIPNDTAFYGETLSKPKHNTLAYGSVPAGYIALFGKGSFSFDGHLSDYSSVEAWSLELAMGIVPLIYWGETDVNFIRDLVDGQPESALGGCPMEGIVVKNYNKPYELYGQHVSLMVGKYVSEQFKEKHKANDNFGSGKSKMELYFESFRTDARWDKAIQHLRDDGQLLEDPKDIGALMKELHRDFDEECAQEVKDKLYGIYRKDVLSKITRGFPEYYKQRLLENLE